MIYIQTYLSFVLSRKIMNVQNDVARKYGNVIVKDFRKYGKLNYKKNKLKLNIDFLNNCKQLDVYPKFLIFKLPNVSKKDSLSIRKRLLLSTITSTNVIKNSNMFQKNSVCLKTFYLHSTIDFYILQNL